jgi:hypothetical protein
MQVLRGTAGTKPVTINENGKRKKITKLDAAVTQLANDAARGDKKSIQLAFATTWIGLSQSATLGSLILLHDLNVCSRIVARGWLLVGLRRTRSCSNVQAEHLPQI